MSRDLLSVDEVAAFLDVGPVTIYRWCRDGRLPCTKIGKSWRIHRSALDDFLRRGERRQTLVSQLQSFLDVPDHVIAVAETKELLHRLDAAFFQVGESRGGVLVKFYAGEPASSDQLRVAFTQYGLEVLQLEDEGRLHFCEEDDPLAGRAELLRRVLRELAGEGRTIWAAFDWVEQVDLDEAMRQQHAMMAVVDASRLVLKTSILQQVVDSWPPASQRRAQYLFRGIIGLSEKRLVLSRVMPTPLT